MSDLGILGSTAVFSATMDQRERLHRFDRFYEGVHRKIISDVICPNPQSKALDVGCGAGGMTALLAAALDRGVVVGLDTNTQNLLATRREVRRAGASGRVALLIGDVENLQFLAGEFDLIWCSRVIHHHLPNPQRALSEMYRVLKPGGTLFLRENSNSDLAVSIPSLRIDFELSRRLRLANVRWFQSKFKSRRLTAEEWLRRMEESGFDNLHFETVSFQPAHPRHQLAYIHSWLSAVLEDHESPEYGSLLEADVVDQIRRTIAELEQWIEKPDSVLDGIEIHIENTNPILIGSK